MLDKASKHCIEYRKALASKRLKLIEPISAVCIEGCLYSIDTYLYRASILESKMTIRYESSRYIGSFEQRFIFKELREKGVWVNHTNPAFHTVFIYGCPLIAYMLPGSDKIALFKAQGIAKLNV